MTPGRHRVVRRGWSRAGSSGMIPPRERRSRVLAWSLVTGRREDHRRARAHGRPATLARSDEFAHPRAAYRRAGRHHDVYRPAGCRARLPDRPRSSRCVSRGRPERRRGVPGWACSRPITLYHRVTGRASWTRLSRFLEPAPAGHGRPVEYLGERRLARSWHVPARGLPARSRLLSQELRAHAGADAGAAPQHRPRHRQQRVRPRVRPRPGRPRRADPRRLVARVALRPRRARRIRAALLRRLPRREGRCRRVRRARRGSGIPAGDRGRRQLGHCRSRGRDAGDRIAAPAPSEPRCRHQQRARGRGRGGPGAAGKAR